jgi:ABC-type uncharacterized transport system permease subunit
MLAKNDEKIQYLGHFFGRALGKKIAILCVSVKIKINRGLVGILWNFADPLYVFLKRVLQKKNIKIRFRGHCFGALSFRHVKKSYLIRPL